jgi:integrase
MRALPGVHTAIEAKKVLAVIESNVTQGRVGIIPKTPAGLVREAMEKWLATFKNRNAKKDEQRARKHLLPAFGDMTITTAQDSAVLLPWLDKVRADGELQEQTLRGLLTLLSGFWSWAVDRRMATMNPVRQLPRKERPKRKEAQADVPWLKTDAEVWAVLAVLREPVRTAFWLGNRTGMRPGEVAGLQLRDLDQMGEGVIRVQHSYAGPLKEDKKGDGQVKWVPAPADVEKWLGPLLAERRAQGAGDDDVLFRYVPETGRPRKDPTWEGITEDLFKHAWREVRLKIPKLKGMRYYHATRHSFVSRCLAAGASMDEVSAAVGHSSILVTKAAYAHFVRKNFSATLRAPLQISTAKPETAAVTDDGEAATGGSTANRKGRDPE